MFDAIGRKGRTKKLSPYRWVASWVIGLIFIAATWASYDVIQNLPRAAAKVDEEPTDITFKKVAPPPPPPPPPQVPKQTTKPLKNVLTKKVVQKEIKDPTPTPPPPKDAPTPEEEPEAALADAGSMGGVEGGVVGGVIGGVVGGTGDGTGAIKEIDFEDAKLVFKGKPVYPSMAKRNKIEGSARVEITCLPDGSTRARWLDGNELFKDSVMTAAAQFRCEPQSEATKFIQPFNFRLKS